MRQIALAVAVAGGLISTAVCAGAAVIVQDQPFALSLDLVGQQGTFRFEDGVDGLNQFVFGNNSSTVWLQPFDSALGELREVTVSFESSFSQAVTYVYFSSAGHIAEGVTLAVPLRLAFGTFGVRGGPGTNLFSVCTGDRVCAATAEEHGIFNRSRTPVLAPYLEPAPVGVRLSMDLVGFASYFPGNPPHLTGILGEVVADWSGVVRVTYQYEPLEVPPPAAIPAPGGAALLGVTLLGLGWTRAARPATG